MCFTINSKSIPIKGGLTSQRYWLIPAIILALLYTDGLGQEFNVMSLNVRLANSGDGEDNWEYRREAMVNTIQRYAPSFLGIQEGLLKQVEYLDSALTSYRFVGVGRDNGLQAGEFSAIFYDTTKFRCEWSKTFWLSETPEVPSKGWDASFKRVCTYGLFTSAASGNMVLVLNTHYDHEGEEARRQSSHMILDTISRLRNEYPVPLIFMGDFNALPDEEPVQIITEQLSDALAVSDDPLRGPPGTFNGFEIDTTPDRRIDYIFVRDLNVQYYRHVDDKTKSGRWISDHLPVVATVAIE